MPFAVTTPAANHHAATLGQLTVDFYTIGAKPGNLIGHRPCHIGKLEMEIRESGAEMIAPCCSNRFHKTTQYRRLLRF